MEGGGHDLNKALVWQLHVGTEENRETLVRISIDLSEI